MMEVGHGWDVGVAVHVLRVHELGRGGIFELDVIPIEQQVIREALIGGGWD
jgi:hypothetical protein